jgi:predicted metal-binding membrane protein
LLRDRVSILAALGGVTALAWFYMWLLVRQTTGAPGMGGMDGMAICPVPMSWTAANFALMLVMWCVMMVGMMLPSAAPVLLTFATVNRRKRARREPFVPTAMFAAGYLAAWAGFSLAATLAQWGLEQASLMTPMMETTSPIVGGILLIAAGLFQLTPLKHACIEKCRSPLDFVLNRWREGAAGAFAMGLGHGLHCLGCCWLLMVLMFVGGVMNLLWMAALAVVVFIEKLFPAGQWIARVAGAAMLILGIYVMTQA